MEGSLVSGWGGIWHTPIGQAVLRLKLRFFSDAGGAAQDIGEVRQTLSREQRNAQAARLLTEYGNSILRLAYSYLHTQSDAEDIVQDTLIRFLKTGPVLENPAHEKAWLLRVAANLCKNRIAYNRVRTADELSEELAEIQYQLPGGTVNYRMSAGEQDNSGDYNTYPQVRQITVSGCTVTLKGAAERVSLAIWSKDGYAYSLGFADGMAASEAVMLLESAIA